MPQTLGELLDDPERMHHMLNRNAAQFAVLQAVNRLGLPDLLDGPTTVADLATRTGAHSDGLARLLAYLAADRVLDFDGDTVTPSPRTAALRQMGPAIGNDRLSMLAAFELDRALCGEGTAFELHFGQPPFEFLADSPADGENFARLMQLTTQLAERAIFANHDFGTFTCAVDVGGNRGSLLLRLLADRPDARGVLFDLPATVADAGPALAGHPLADRIEAVGGSFFEAVPEGGDLYLLKQILHDWGDAECETILRHIRRAIAPHGRLAIIERLVPEAMEPHNARDLDILMLLWTGKGCERTLAQLADMLGRCGFALERTSDGGRSMSVIEAVPV